MPAFTYTARALNGDLRTATIDAPNRDEVVAQLRRQRLNVVKIDEAAQATEEEAGGKITMRDIVIFTRQFSTMINAGLPLVQALDILAKQSENKALKDVTRAGGVRRRVGPHASPTRCASIRRRSRTSTSTWSPPVRRVVSSIPS